jgi:hypothetical protein
MLRLSKKLGTWFVTPNDCELYELPMVIDREEFALALELGDRASQALNLRWQ